MDPRSRASLIKRYQAIAGKDAIVPTSWEQIGSLGLKLKVESDDPELASVLKGQMPADLELAVISGKWSEEAPAPRDEKAEREAAVAKWFADHPVASPEEQQRQLNERLAEQEQMRINSMVATYGRWEG
jgi:hypothetical protein